MKILVLGNCDVHFATEFPWWVHTILSLAFGIYMPWLAYRYFMAHPESKFVKISAFLLGQNIRKPISFTSKSNG